MLCLGDDNSPVAYRVGRHPHTKHSLQDRRRLRPAIIIIIILYTHILFTQVRVRVTEGYRERTRKRPTLTHDDVIFGGI